MWSERFTGVIYILHRHNKSLDYICVKSEVVSEKIVIDKFMQWFRR